MIPGLAERVTSGGIPVLRLHYSADPGKRPGTPDGDAWLAQGTQGYPGGTNSPRWRKEMEIDYGALGGTKLFPDWESWATAGHLVVQPFVPTGYRLYASYDHGWRNPACYYVHGVGSDGQIVTLWECYGDHIPVGAMAKVILGEPVRLPDGRVLPGNPFAGQETWRIADPSIWAEDQPMADGTNKGIVELFRRAGVYFTKGEKGGDTMVAEWLLGYWWKDPTAPLYRITTDCPKLIWELGRQRHKDVSGQVALNRDQPEELVDKDNHSWDALKMFLKRFPPKPADQRATLTPNTFLWWRQQTARAKQGLPMRSFSREMVR